MPQNGNDEGTAPVNASSEFQLGTHVVEHALQPDIPPTARQGVDFADFDFPEIGMISLTPESTDICMGQYSDWFLQGWEHDYAGDSALFAMQ